MATDLCSKLSPREGECLIAFLSGGSIKAAALSLGISPQTVKQHLATARGKLGATDSFTAARQWEAYNSTGSSGAEGDPPIQPTPSQGLASVLRLTDREAAATVLPPRENATPARFPGGLDGLLLQLARRPDHDRTTGQRLGVLLGQALLSSVTLLAIVLIVKAAIDALSTR